MASASSTFQTATGTTTPEAAAARIVIHQERLRDAELKALPVLHLHTAAYQLTLQGHPNDWDSSGTIGFALYCAAGDGTAEAEYLASDTLVEGLLTDLAALAGTGAYMGLKTLRVNRIVRGSDDRSGTAGPWIRIEGEAQWPAEGG